MDIYYIVDALRQSAERSYVFFFSAAYQCIHLAKGIDKGLIFLKENGQNDNPDVDVNFFTLSSYIHITRITLSS